MKQNDYNLVGIDGNAFAIMGQVSSWMKTEKFNKTDIDKYISEATSSDYFNLLCVSMEYVNKCNVRKHQREQEK